MVLGGGGGQRHRRHGQQHAKGAPAAQRENTFVERAEIGQNLIISEIDEFMAIVIYLSCDHAGGHGQDAATGNHAPSLGQAEGEDQHVKLAKGGVNRL